MSPSHRLDASIQIHSLVPMFGSLRSLRSSGSRSMSSVTQTKAHQPRRLDLPNLDGFFARVQEVNTARDEVNVFPRLYVDDKVAGYVRPEFAAQLLQYKDVFQEGKRPGVGVQVLEFKGAKTSEERTKAIDYVCRDLKDKGVITGWREEKYPAVCAYHEPPLFLIERAAAPFFGVKAYGVHVNGYVRKPDGIYLWVARRSRVKPTWPGMLDHIVAGGQPFGISCFDNVIKEAEEEASIPLELAENAVPTGVVSYATLSKEGLKRDVLFVYDIELPVDFVPKPLDGEVEEFFLMPIPQVAEIIRTSEQYKPNCNLVVIDFLIRHGYIVPEHPGYLQLLQSLRVGDCA